MANVEIIEGNSVGTNFWSRYSIKNIVLSIHVFFFLLAFFLSQAVMFDAAVPFLLPLWAITRLRYEREKNYVLAGGIVGALQLSLGQCCILILQLLIFEGIYRFKYWKMPLSLTVAISLFFGQFFWQGVVHWGPPPFIVQLYVFYEVVLGFITTIFMKVFFAPPHLFWKLNWSYERVGAGLVILALTLTGMNSIFLFYFAPQPFLLHLLILVAGFVGGVPIATMVATILGALIGIAELSFTGMMALYALTGVATGLFKGISKIAAMLTSLLPSIFFFFYDTSLPLDEVYFVSIVLASIIFLFLPDRLFSFLKDALYPKREEVLLARQQWLTDHATEKLQTFQSFVLFMKELVYDRFTSTQSLQQPQKIEPYQVCMNCLRYERCWENRVMEKPIQDWFDSKLWENPMNQIRCEDIIKRKCIKASQLLQELDYWLYHNKMNGQIYHGKKMIALQLKDLSNHLNQLMEHMKDEALTFHSIEEELERLFKNVNISCIQTDVLNNTSGERIVICSFPAKYNDGEFHLLCERIILPIFHEVFSEPFYVEKIVEQNEPFHHIQVRFRSALRYKIEYDIYSKAKSGNFISGDSHSVFHIHPGLVAIMLSDGMGQNREAKRESRRLIRLMRECLTYNLNPETAMHTLHYVLSLNKKVDMYATIDFALVDLQRGALWSWKAGSMSTYILRGERLIRIDGKSAPVGFMPNFTIETERVNLLANDYVVMISDGLFSSQIDWEEQEQYFISILKDKITDGVPTSAILLDAMDQFKFRYDIDDDCTVIIFRVDHVAPKWSVFSSVSNSKKIS